MRQFKQLAIDYPGTVRMSRVGMCQTCYRHETGRTTAPAAPVYVHAELSAYTPAQTKRVTALFGRDVEIMRMLGMVK
jgi:hypothetical protein